MSLASIWLCAVAVLCLASVAWVIDRLRGFGDGIPIVNRRYALEPSFMSRMRWTASSAQILQDAHEKYKGGVFRLIRGDADVLIVPVDYIPEMNKISVSILNPRRGHMQTLTGNLNGLDAVNRTDRHIKLLNTLLTPSLPGLWKPLCTRVQNKMKGVFPQSDEVWTPLDPVNTAAALVADAINVFLFGTPACDDPEIAQLSVKVSQGIFYTIFIGRLLPTSLRRSLIWLFPQKWRLQAIWKDAERILYPELQRRREKLDELTSRDFMTSLLQEKLSADPQDELYIVSRLIGVVQTGSTHSTSTVISGVLAYLATHPRDLELVREEINNKQLEAGDNWDQAAFDSLDKLDSALKEAARLIPASVLSYVRQTLEPYTFTNGLRIRKGQHLAVSVWPRIMDPEVFPEPEKFIALREYNRGLDEHRAAPYRKFDTQELRWGTGKWACPGRYLASAVAKMILVKIIDEYDLRIVGDDVSPRKFMHEFAFIDPNVRIAFRRRKSNSGIRY